MTLAASWWNLWGTGLRERALSWRGSWDRSRVLWQHCGRHHKDRGIQGSIFRTSSRNKVEKRMLEATTVAQLGWLFPGKSCMYATGSQSWWWSQDPVSCTSITVGVASATRWGPFPIASTEGEGRKFAIICKQYQASVFGLQVGTAVLNWAMVTMSYYLSSIFLIKKKIIREE